MGARPSRIEKARIEGDTAYLSAAGRRGGRATAQRWDIKRMSQQRADERRADEEHARMVQANEHVIPLSTYE